MGLPIQANLSFYLSQNWTGSPLNRIRQRSQGEIPDFTHRVSAVSIFPIITPRYKFLVSNFHIKLSPSILITQIKLRTEFVDWTKLHVRVSSSECTAFMYNQILREGSTWLLNHCRQKFYNNQNRQQQSRVMPIMSHQTPKGTEWRYYYMTAESTAVLVI